MLKKILIGVAGLLLLVIGGAMIGLISTHRSITHERVPLPPPDRVVASGKTPIGPNKLRYVNTASQVMPRSGVLDPGQDPKPNDPYIMSHPSFVLEWSDGRILLVDVGMTRDGATAFGSTLQKLGGAQAIEPHGSTAEQLGPARVRVAAAIFTHLHSDHVGGITELAADRGRPLLVFQTEAQAERPNYTTRGGLKLLQQTPSIKLERLGPGPLHAVPGFPGVFVIAAGGHTPGSQLVVAHVTEEGRTRTVVFVGDIVNNIDGINNNIPKPYLYRLLMVPEDDQRQEELRLYLRNLRDRFDAQLLVAHDQLAIENSGVAKWSE